MPPLTIYQKNRANLEATMEENPALAAHMEANPQLRAVFDLFILKTDECVEILLTAVECILAEDDFGEVLAWLDEEGGRMGPVLQSALLIAFPERRATSLH